MSRFSILSDGMLRNQEIFRSLYRSFGRHSGDPRRLGLGRKNRPGSLRASDPARMRLKAMTMKDEERIRRIIRRAVVLSHDEESDQDVGAIFDLLPYLKP